MNLLSRSEEIMLLTILKLGDDAYGVGILLSKEFVKCVIIANIIAWPVAWFYMNRFLENYPFRVNIGIDVFLLAGLAALAIAVITVSRQAFRSARSNPVDALKYE